MTTAKKIIIEILQGEGLMYAYRDFASDIKDDHIEKIAEKIVKNLNMPAECLHPYKRLERNANGLWCNKCKQQVSNDPNIY